MTRPNGPKLGISEDQPDQTVVDQTEQGAAVLDAGLSADSAAQSVEANQVLAPPPILTVGYTDLPSETGAIRTSLRVAYTLLYYIAWVKNQIGDVLTAGLRTASQAVMGNEFSLNAAYLAQRVYRYGVHKNWWLPADPKLLPELLPDASANYRIKADFQRTLKDPTILQLPLPEMIRVFAVQAFDKEIPPEYLIEFLSDYRIVDIIFNAVLSSDHDSSDQVARNRSRMQRMGLKPVTRDLAGQFLKELEHFRLHYDPMSPDFTIINFVQSLCENYPDYDILGWLATQGRLFREIVVGGVAGYNRYDHNLTTEEAAKIPASKPHIHRIIDEQYKEIGIARPRKLIQNYLHRFFGVMRDTDEQSRVSVHINEKALAEFFEGPLSHASKEGEHSLVDLRKTLIEVCWEAIDAMTGEDRPKTILWEDEDGYFSEIECEDTEELKTKLAVEIENDLQVMSSHADVLNLLADPAAIPAEFYEYRDNWFNAEGKIIENGPYEEFLRGIFAHSTVRGERKEGFNRVKERVAEMFNDINNYCDDIANQLAIPSFVRSQSVRACNDYAELILIATDPEKDPLERWEARRKIELVTLLYSCSRAPRVVFQDHEASEVKRQMQEHNRISLKDTDNISITYIDDPEDGVRSVNTPQALGEFIHPDDRHLKVQSLRSLDLIPASFAGTDCYLLIGGEDEDELLTHPDSSRRREGKNYINKKSIFSMLTKLLRGSAKRAEDVTDQVRMTFVVNNEAGLPEIQHKLENDFLSFGKVVKIEDRYGLGTTAKSSRVDGQINASKSDKYRTLRYVVKIPIRNFGEAQKKFTYLIPVEIRVLLVEDLVRERSRNHDAGHIKYEIRRMNEVLTRVAPIDFYPDLYKETPPHPLDRFKRSKIVPKSAKDFIKEEAREIIAAYLPGLGMIPGPPLLDS